jgi:hypothetical protein
MPVMYFEKRCDPSEKKNSTAALCKLVPVWKHRRAQIPMASGRRCIRAVAVSPRHLYNTEMKQHADSRGFEPAQYKIFAAASALVGPVLLDCQIVFAAPMRCSGEQKICITNCNKSTDRSSISICVTNCGARQSVCMKTGCWDSGFQKYCGLLKQ